MPYTELTFPTKNTGRCGNQLRWRCLCSEMSFPLNLLSEYEMLNVTLQCEKLFEK